MLSIKQYSVPIKLKYNNKRETCDCWILTYIYTQDKFVIYSPVFANTTSRGSNDVEFNDGSIGHSLKRMHTRTYVYATYELPIARMNFP